MSTVTCTVTFKGHKDPQDPQLVKLEMVFYKSGYTRVPRVINITGAYKCWNSKSQSFDSSSSEYVKKNQLLLELKERYLTVVEQWQKAGVNFSALQWADCFKKQQEDKPQAKVLTVQQTIEARHDFFSNFEKYKNGRIVRSEGTAKGYRGLLRSLQEFTQSRYNLPLSRYHFTDITRQFILDYTLYLEKKGIEHGNRGCLRQRLRLLRAVVNYAAKEEMYGADPEIFGSVREKMAWGQFESKAVDANIIRRIEYMDRSLLEKREDLYLDLFLFSFYAGGMANVDTIGLTWDMIDEKEQQIIYERMKFPKLAKPLIISKMKAILDKYRGQGIENYVFPVYTAKQQTDKQRIYRRNNTSYAVSKTLDKICRILGIEEDMTWYTARGTFITNMLDDGNSLLHVAEMAGNSARVIEKHYYKNTQKEKLLQRMNAKYGGWGGAV